MQFRKLSNTRFIFGPCNLRSLVCLRDLDWLLVECDQYTDHQKALGTFGKHIQSRREPDPICREPQSTIMEKYWEEQIMSATGSRVHRTEPPIQQIRQIICDTQVTVTTVLSSLKEEDLLQYTRLRLQASGCRFRQY